MSWKCSLCIRNPDSQTENTTKPAKNIAFIFDKIESRIRHDSVNLKMLSMRRIAVSAADESRSKTKAYQLITEKSLNMNELESPWILNRSL